MSLFKANKYSIEIYVDDNFKESSEDNLHNYDFVYIKKSDNYYTSSCGIKIILNELILKSAIIGSFGGCTGIHNKSVIIEEDRILICCSNSVFCLSIPNLSLLWCTESDLITCFEIYNYLDNYIIHGELSISRLDKNGEIVWQVGGKDIFTTLDSENDFELFENYIIATDFDYNKYKIDYLGNCQILNSNLLEKNTNLFENHLPLSKKTKWWQFWK